MYDKIFVLKFLLANCENIFEIGELCDKCYNKAEFWKFFLKNSAWSKDFRRNELYSQDETIRGYLRAYIFSKINFSKSQTKLF